MTALEELAERIRRECRGIKVDSIRDGCVICTGPVSGQVNCFWVRQFREWTEELESFARPASRQRPPADPVGDDGFAQLRLF